MQGMPKKSQSGRRKKRQADHNRKKQYIDGILNTFNKGTKLKENKAHDLASPDYRGSTKMTPTGHMAFPVWLKKDGAVI
ncbi:hypothetical protein ACH95_14960 [Bacillus glycinifermentans]|nr:hypothetical protein ACH95_14960 [Bacillus glycinifermentans]